MQLAKITIATVNTEAMVTFYNTIFDADLRALDGFDTLLYAGRIAGIRLILCPHDYLGTSAEPSRQQFKFMTPLVDGLIKRVLAAGGEIEHTEHDSLNGRRSVWVRDPDGNSIEFEQPSPAMIG